MALARVVKEREIQREKYKGRERIKKRRRERERDEITLVVTEMQAESCRAGGVGSRHCLLRPRGPSCPGHLCIHFDVQIHRLHAVSQHRIEKEIQIQILRRRQPPEWSQPAVTPRIT